MTTYVHKNTQQFFPFSPELSSWEDWNGNFIIYYGQLNVPYNIEDNWKNTAEVIQSMASDSRTFMAQGRRSGTGPRTKPQGG